MTISIDNVFGIHEDAMRIQTRRAQLLAQNLANSDTPGYKAKDIDFRAALQQMQSGSAAPLKVTRPGHIQPDGTFLGVEEMYRIPTQPSLDGNTVEPHVEMGEFTDNSMRYLMTLRIMSGRIKGMMSAIRGE